jgi:protein-S-isoprenylcysteine O-methyltransferase Ste14
LIGNIMRVGPWLYGLLFCVVLPLGLVHWAVAAEKYITVILPLHGFWPVGLLVAGIGLSLVLCAMQSLWVIGRGLPMNAYPPEHYVTTGIYRWLRHPIYLGAVIACLGFSIAGESNAGFLLITPCLVLFIVALVLGYEGEAMRRRWPRSREHHPLLGPPADRDSQASIAQRLAVMTVVFIPWLLLYYLLILLGDADHLQAWYLPGEAAWPVCEWTESIYILTYPFVLLTPLVLRTERQLRQFVHSGWWLIGAGIYLSYVLPCHAPPRECVVTGFWGELLLWERGLDGPVCALPSFHVMWALMAAVFWSMVSPRGKVLFWLLAILMSISCCTVGNHLVVDVLAGYLVFGFIWQRQRVWKLMQRACERLANSWQAWQMGSLRIINHSLWAGLAAAVGIVVVGQVVREAGLLVLLSFMTLAGGCLWGQWVTGSPKLLRPFGYYGAIVGALLGCGLILYWGDYDFITLCAAAALAAPWVQAIGRLRCLVQGCCHGRATNAECGIVVTNPHSRVVAISGLGGQSIHLTQLYSILANVVIGLFLFRLQYSMVSPALLCGLYGILNGVARFVEEAYRGEAQTPIISGLRLYQWLALASVIVGVIFTCLPGPMYVILSWRCDLSLVSTSLISGLMAAFLMGMDFPQSHFRFARLSG